MSNIFQVGKTYDPREVLTLLAADVDSDEEDFDESNFIITEQENSSQDDEDECAENESLENENLHPPNSNSESILSRDGTIWENRPPNANGRTSRRNIIRTRLGTKQFILDKVDTALDVFKELWGHQNFECILRFTKAEALRQGNTTFSISKQELDAFFGLCLLRGVFKGRNEPLSSFWESDHGRPIFRETMSRNKFQSILRYIRFDDKNSRPIRRRIDKFAAIRELWNSVMDNCQKSYFPHADVTVDEQLFPCRSRLVRIFDKQYLLLLLLSSPHSHSF